MQIPALIYSVKFSLYIVNRLSNIFQATEQQAGAPHDVRELVSEEKGVPKKKFVMDPALEDKICDLYDLFVDVLLHVLSDLRMVSFLISFKTFLHLYLLMILGTG